MANNYLQFSFELPTTPEQRKWMDDTMVKWFDEPGYSDYYDQGRSWTLEHDDTSTVIYADDYGNTEHLADFLQAYLKEFVLWAPIAVEWAMSCDKLRPNEFGGGAFVVWQNRIEWMGTSQWIDQIAKTSTLNV